MRHISFFSVPISITSRGEALAVITQWVIERGGSRSTRGTKSTTGEKAHRSPARGTRGTFDTRGTFPKLITTPNPEMIVAAQKDQEFLQALRSADLAIPDGVGVILALRLLASLHFALRTSHLSRISGLSLMEDLVSLSAQRGWRVMLVGGQSGVAEKAAQKLRLSVFGSQLSDNGLPVSRLTGQQKTDEQEAENRKPRTDNIIGISAPPDLSHASPSDLNNLLNSINSFSPDLLFVGFGHGKQETWLHANRYTLHAAVAMGVGGAFDQIVDPTLRPPDTINSIGLGWLYRLVRQPRRWRRQLALVSFAWMVCRLLFKVIVQGKNELKN